MQVLEIARRLASSSPEGLAALRDAGLLQACLFIIKCTTPGSHNAKCAVNLVGRAAEWDESSRHGPHPLTQKEVLRISWCLGDVKWIRISGRCLVSQQPTGSCPTAIPAVGYILYKCSIILEA